MIFFGLSGCLSDSHNWITSGYKYWTLSGGDGIQRAASRGNQRATSVFSSPTAYESSVRASSPFIHQWPWCATEPWQLPFTLADFIYLYGCKNILTPVHCPQRKEITTITWWNDWFFVYEQNKQKQRVSLVHTIDSKQKLDEASESEKWSQLISAFNLHKYLYLQKDVCLWERVRLPGPL